MKNNGRLLRSRGQRAIGNARLVSGALQERSDLTRIFLISPPSSDRISSAATMIVSLSLLSSLAVTVLRPCSAFSNVPDRCKSHFGVKARPFLPPVPFKTRTRLASTFGSDDEPLETDISRTNSTRSVEMVTDDSVDEAKKKGFLGRYRGQKLTRASLAKLGGSVLLSYGFVSNVFGITCVSCAWYIASRKVGGIKQSSWCNTRTVLNIVWRLFLLVLSRPVSPHWHLDSGKDSWQSMQHSLPF